VDGEEDTIRGGERKKNQFVKIEGEWWSMKFVRAYCAVAKLSEDKEKITYL